MRLFFLILTLHACLLGAAAHAATSLPAPVARALESAGIPQSAVGVWVGDAVGDAVGGPASLALNGDKAMNPASVMKLVTTWTALETLGPAWTWRTEAWTTGELKNGVLAGDLYLKGGGDPRLTMENFWLLLRQLRSRGVTDIAGDLVLDRSLYAATATIASTPEGFDEEPTNPYNVGPDPLLVNFKAVRFTLIPDPASKKIKVLPEPWPEQVALDNRLSLSAGPCEDWSDGLSADWRDPAAGTSQRLLVLTGAYPLACGEKIWNRALLSPPAYVDGVFRQFWRELGGRIVGGLRQASVPSDARLIASFQSPPLAEVIRDINKFSNNVMARQLFLSLAANTPARPLSPADGDRAVRSFLSARRLDFPELVLENGSGLSRKERISAQNLGRLLQAAWASPLAPEFVASLPLVGIDGTMKKRLVDKTAMGRGHLKTGTLNGVKALAGYVQDVNGQTRIVVFLVNHAKAASAGPAMDALVETVANASLQP